MYTIRKISNHLKPLTFQSLNNGFWHYNFNIVSNTRQEVKNEDKVIDTTEYVYSYVRIEGTPTVEKCYNQVLSAYKNENGTSLYDILTTKEDKESRELADKIYESIQVDFGLKEPLSDLEKAKKDILQKIEDYDVSKEVNSFYLNGLQVWLDKDTRVGLMNSLTIEKNAGKEESTLWFNNICITINCDAAIQMLSALELYALSCYNATAQHKVAVQNLTTLDEVMNYDFTTGYPEKLNFTI